MPAFGTAGIRVAAAGRRGEGSPGFWGECEQRALSYGVDFRGDGSMVTSLLRG
jgi:hypothetical protein